MESDNMNWNLKRILLCIAVLAGFFVSCNPGTHYEKAILQYMRVETGMQALDIAFSDVQVIMHTVKDSVNMLKQQYEEEKRENEEMIKRLQQGVDSWKEKLSAVDDDDKFVIKQLLAHQEKQLKELQGKEIIDNSLHYMGDMDEILAVVVSCQMTWLINPVLKTKQTVKGLFLLSPDGTRCLKRLK